jgi:hypothetical protein
MLTLAVLLEVHLPPLSSLLVKAGLGGLAGAGGGKAAPLLLPFLPAPLAGLSLLNWPFLVLSLYAVYYSFLDLFAGPSWSACLALPNGRKLFFPPHRNHSAALPFEIGGNRPPPVVACAGRDRPRRHRGATPRLSGLFFSVRRARGAVRAVRAPLLRRVPSQTQEGGRPAGGRGRREEKHVRRGLWFSWFWWWWSAGDEVALEQEGLIL